MPAEHTAGNASDAAQDSQVSRLSQDAGARPDSGRRRRVSNELHFRTVKILFPLSLRFNDQFPGEPGLAGVY